MKEMMTEVTKKWCCIVILNVKTLTYRQKRPLVLFRYVSRVVCVFLPFNINWQFLAWKVNDLELYVWPRLLNCYTPFADETVPRPHSVKLYSDMNFKCLFDYKMPGIFHRKLMPDCLTKLMWNKCQTILVRKFLPCKVDAVERKACSLWGRFLKKTPCRFYFRTLFFFSVLPWSCILWSTKYFNFCRQNVKYWSEVGHAADWIFWKERKLPPPLIYMFYTLCWNWFISSLDFWVTVYLSMAMEITALLCFLFWLYPGYQSILIPGRYSDKRHWFAITVSYHSPNVDMGTLCSESVSIVKRLVLFSIATLRSWRF